MRVTKLNTFYYILVGGILFLMIPTLFQEASATVFFSENWDTDSASSQWPCKNAPNSPCSSTESFNGWISPLGDYCNDNSSKDSWAMCGRSSTHARSGSYSFRMHREKDLSDTCDIQHRISSPYPTNVYIRFYLYLPSSMTDYNTPTTDETMTHFMFTNSAFSNTGFRMNWLTKVPYTSPWQCASGVGGVPSGQPYMWFNCENNAEECRVGAPYDCYNLISPSNLNRWQCIEFNFNATTKKMSIWVDGDRKVNNVTVPMSQSNFTFLQFSGFESQIPSHYTLDYYIDDIVVSDTYIGPGGSGDSSAPQAPTNLRVTP